MFFSSKNIHIFAPETFRNHLKKIITMKKTLLFSLALLFATATMAQNRAVIFSESFDGTGMPEGWSTAGLGANNWYVYASSNAGGSPNEAMLYWEPRFNGTSRLVTPAIDLTGLSSVVVNFKHALNNFQGSHTLGVATSSDNGATWNVGWSQLYGSSAQFEVMKEITTTDIGNPSVKFCIFYTGDSYNINNWYFDDFQILTLDNLDGKALSVNVPEVSYGSQPGILSTDVSVGMSMMNMGETPISSVEATYEIAGMEPVTQTFNINIPKLGSSTLNFTETKTLDPGDYDLTITINKVNGVADDNADNNTVARKFYVTMASEEKVPMIEHFSSSTCGPCVSANNQMNTFCNNNQGRFTYTKYQMNWPGNGDPYYTAEGGVRRAYYEVSGVPSVFLDGVSTSVNQNNFNQQAAKPACFDVAGSFTVDGNTINIKADIAPYVSMPVRVYVSVNEKVTHNNTGSNGETSFHHVFMKMMPDGEGSTINFVAGKTQQFEFTQNMASTHVEEMSDLEVSIWVQNYATKEIYNSRFAYEYSDIHPYPVDSLTLAEADGNTMTASWNAPAQGEPIGYNVYVNNELVAENTTETTYSFDADPDVFYVVGVVALYAGEKTSVKSVAAPGSGMQDEGLVVVGSSNVILDIENPSLDLSVQNANLGTMTPIQISSITEGVSEGGPYLNIELATELPATVEAGEEFHFTISPINTGERSYATTSVNVNYDGGTINFLVEIDGELLSVTEITSQAKVYPNPTSGNVRVMAGNNIESVKVYDMLGAMVAIVPANGTSVDVNMSQFSNGVYFFNIRQSDGTVSNQRVVVSH